MNTVENLGHTVRIFCPQNNREYLLESSLLHPLIKGGDSRAFAILPTKRLILFPYGKQADGSTNLISAHTLESQFPLTWAYLLDHRSFLENRENGKMKGAKWYGYVYPKALEVISRPKIFVPDISPDARCSIDEDGSIFFTGGTSGGYGVIPSQNIDMKYLLGLLNSRTLQYFLQNISTPLRGGWYSNEAKYISNLPVPSTQDDFHLKIIDLTDQCIDAAKNVPEKLPALEAELNALVYQAYGLDADDIAVIEAHLAGKSAVGAASGDEEGGDTE